LSPSSNTCSPKVTSAVLPQRPRRSRRQPPLGGHVAIAGILESHAPARRCPAGPCWTVSTYARSRHPDRGGTLDRFTAPGGTQCSTPRHSTGSMLSRQLGRDINPKRESHNQPVSETALLNGENI
jgi:hypothetical protein